jgi:hypothetical protein
MKTFTLFCSFMIVSALSIVNGQTNWFWQNPYPQGNDLYTVKFPSGMTGWAVGKR